MLMYYRDYSICFCGFAARVIVFTNHAQGQKSFCQNILDLLLHTADQIFRPRFAQQLLALRDLQNLDQLSVGILQWLLVNALLQEH